MTELYDALRAQREEMRPAWKPEDTERALLGVGAKRRHRRRKKAASLGALCALLLLIAWAILPTKAPSSYLSPSHDTSQEIAFVKKKGQALPKHVFATPAPASASETLQLPDGSLLLSEAHTAHFEVQAMDETRLEVKLLEGSATFDVTPNPGRRFIVHANQVRVEVLGTRFQVEHTPYGVLVHVAHGRVAVSQPGVPEVILSDDMTYTEAMHQPQKALPKRQKAAPAAPAAPATWQTLAKRADYDQAATSLAAGRDPEGVESLMLAADVMRYTKRPEEALTYLDRVVTAHPTDPRAAIAQFQRGRLLAKMNRPRQAAKAWAKVQTIASVSPSLAEDALAQEAGAWYQVGEFSRAQACARTYLERYPTGHRSKAMRRYATLPAPSGP